MNILTCLLGGFPMCHGAGGLAGQYRFGGRTGASVEFLGVVKIVLGLAFGQRCLELLSSCAFPYAVLGTRYIIMCLPLWLVQTRHVGSCCTEDSYCSNRCNARCFWARACNVGERYQWRGVGRCFSSIRDGETPTHSLSRAEI
jgi:hypothetical protein